MKILITGATGLVGKEIVKKGNELDIPIHFLTTNSLKVNGFSGAKGFYWNPKKNEIDKACFEGVTHLIHLAGATISKRWTTNYKKEIWESRVLGTQLLVETLQQLKHHSLQHVVAASAVGCYTSDYELLQTEKTPVTSHSFLSKVVVDWEKAIDGFSTLSISVTKLRIGLVLAADGGVVLALKWPAKLGLIAALGSGKQGQSWIHLTDLVQLFLTASQEKWEGVYNAVSPHPVNQKEFMHHLAQAYGSFMWLPPMPTFLVRIPLGAMSTLMFNSHWISASKVEAKGFKFEFPELKHALSNLI